MEMAVAVTEEDRAEADSEEEATEEESEEETSEQCGTGTPATSGCRQAAR